jgi:carbamoyltransferase
MARVTGLREELARALEVDPRCIRARYHRVEHHLAHLASAFFVSPFDQAAVLSADGLGDFASTMWATGRGNRLETHGAVAFPHSLGLFYTALSQYLGFWNYGDEYKVMGLSAYGKPEYMEEFQRILLVGARHPDFAGSDFSPDLVHRGIGLLKPETGGVPLQDLGFRLGLKYFVHQRTGPQMTWEESDKTPQLGQLFSSYLEERLGPRRHPDEPLEEKHKNLAASLQATMEEAYFKLLNSLSRRTQQRAVCLAGGVAFNCVANGKIFDRTPFTGVYIQPAAGDAGLAVGAAYWVHHQTLGHPRSFVMDHAYWGPKFTSAQLRGALERSPLSGGNSKINELAEEGLVNVAAKRLAEGKVVGWFQGRQCWGPRALGNRSILADPQRAEMTDLLNARVKHREPFRPFAPSILEESTAEFFEQSYPSPFMNLAYLVRPEKRSIIPAPTHVDGTGRLQTVSRQTNPLFWSLIREFQKVTGVPVLLNTSFNDNEPIVLTPDEAIDCFLRTRMDVLVLGNYLVEKQESGVRS